MPRRPAYRRGNAPRFPASSSPSSAGGHPVAASRPPLFPSPPSSAPIRRQALHTVYSRGVSTAPSRRRRYRTRESFASDVADGPVLQHSPRAFLSDHSASLPLQSSIDASAQDVADEGYGFPSDSSSPTVVRHHSAAALPLQEDARKAEIRFGKRPVVDVLPDPAVYGVNSIHSTGENQFLRPELGNFLGHRPHVGEDTSYDRKHEFDKAYHIS